MIPVAGAGSSASGPMFPRDNFSPALHHLSVFVIRQLLGYNYALELAFSFAPKPVHRSGAFRIAFHPLIMGWFWASPAAVPTPSPLPPHPVPAGSDLRPPVQFCFRYCLQRPSLIHV